MGRANFGGQADPSQAFQFLYEQYAQRQQDLANRAVRDAEEEQSAKDEDQFNRWQAGEITDAQWLAYAKSRLAGATDEEAKTYWKDVIRDSSQQITTNRIEGGARPALINVACSLLPILDSVPCKRSVSAPHWQH